jgi:hypothetical protein
MKERLQHLISKLREQFEQNAPPSQMLVTVKLIEAELGVQQAPANRVSPSTKVAVVMPSSLKYAPLVLDPDSVPQNQGVNWPSDQGSSAQPVPKKVDSSDWILDPLSEIPTLSHQQKAREINDVVGINGTSLNDKLKEDVIDLAAAINEAPVRELKKAIGVNDRYVFINELFRGDEVMYERSIKTINNFRILPEAEYWMERELKIKLGWDDSGDVVRRFYQVVKRRFS